MENLSLAFVIDEAGGVQHELALRLYKREAWASILLEEAVAPDGRPWVEVLNKRGNE